MYSLNSSFIASNWQFYAWFKERFDAEFSAKELHKGGLTAKVEYNADEPRKPWSVYVLIQSRIEEIS